MAHAQVVALLRLFPKNNRLEQETELPVLGSSFSFEETMNPSLLKENESLEDLLEGGLHIIQSKDAYRFTSDAILLSRFVRVKKGDVLLDFGTGSGIILLHLLALGAPIFACYGLELQPVLCDMARRSVELNNLTEKMTVIEGRIQDASRIFAGKRIDLIVCNPPYRPLGCGETSLSESDRIARHEEKVTLSEIVKSAAKVLKDGGRFCFVHRADRVSEALALLEQNGFGLKRLCFCHVSEEKPAHLFFAEARRGSVSAPVVEPPMILQKTEQKTE